MTSTQEEQEKKLRASYKMPQKLFGCEIEAVSCRQCEQQQQRKKNRQRWNEMERKWKRKNGNGESARAKR